MINILSKISTKTPRIIPIVTILCAFTAVIGSTLLFSNSAHAELDEATLDFFNTNGINYYNPSGGCDDSANDSEDSDTTNIQITGGDIPEKVWNYFVSANIPGISDNPAAIAGIMGNIEAESVFDPFNTNGSYCGLYQSECYGPLKKAMSGLPAWGSKNVSESDIDKAIKVQLDALVNNKNWSVKRFTDYVNSIKKAGSKISGKEGAKIAAELFMVAVERCVGTGGFPSKASPVTYEEARDLIRKIGISSSHITGVWQNTAGRRDFAAKHYDAPYAKKTATSSSSSSSSSSSPAKKTNGSDVTIIGDSITEMSKNAIKDLLPKATINSKVGRQFAKSYDDSGYENLKKIVDDDKLRNVLVFALGTNDSGLKKSQVEEVLDLVKKTGDSHRIIFMTDYDAKHKNKYKNNNLLLKNIAKKNDNVSLIDWASAAAEDPGKYISSDGIHPTEAGQKLFAKLINDAVNDVSSNSSTSTNSVDLCEPRGTTTYSEEGIPQYFQKDYEDVPFGTSNMGAAGCGPTSFAMMATALLGKEITPRDIGKIPGIGKMYVNGAGSSWGLTEFLAKYYKLKYKFIGTCDINTINKYLQDGWMIHVSGKPGLGTGEYPFPSAHYVGITTLKDGKWYIADSASRTSKRQNGWYDPKQVVRAGMACGNVRAIKAP